MKHKKIKIIGICGSLRQKSFNMAILRAADVILFISPEYNYSVPGVLKNAIDWASRPYGDSAWDGKLAAIIGAASSMSGTSRMQYHLRQIFVFLNVETLNKPEVMIPDVANKINATGELIDEKTKEKIHELLETLIKRTETRAKN